MCFKELAEGVGFEPTVRSRVQRFSSLMVVVLSDVGEVVFALFRTVSAEIRSSLISFCIEQCCLVRLQSRLHFDGLRVFIHMALDRS